jgi:hypothetical protein
VRIDLGYRPRAWQQECHVRRQRFTVLALHRRAGKTELALRQLLDSALRFDQPLGLFLYVAPLLKQAKVIAWSRLKQIVAPLVEHRLAEVNESELRIILQPSGASIRIFGADNPDSMRGLRVDGVVLDEVADIKPETWREVLQPALADRLGWAAFIGTPHGINLFSELFFGARGRPDWHAASYTCYDTDALLSLEIERYRSSVDENTFKREMLCDFAAAGDNQLISLSDVQLACQRHLKAADYSWAGRVLGIDPARFGDDRSVVFPRQGLFAGKPWVFKGLDNMALADRIAQIIEDWKPDAVFCDAGNGAGVIDRLRQLHYDVTEVAFSASPAHARYLNKRAEMWWDVREWLRAGGAIPDLVELKQDLAAPTYRFTPADKIQLESKDDLKARGLPSPDLGDALALTFAYPVHRDESVVARAQRMGLSSRTSSEDVLAYDPYRRL